MAWMTSPEVTAGANPARRLIRDLVADDCPCYSPPDLKSETCLCLRSAIAFLRLIWAPLSSSASPALVHKRARNSLASALPSCK